jgi:16S rRNA (cytosine967-C5)-methyltransferase
LDEEGSAQIDTFLSANSGWKAIDPLVAGHMHGAGRRLTPSQDDTDGFFIAALERAC